MPENIRLQRSNFCVGPQIGTYCSVNNQSSPVSLQVKNTSGTLVRTYFFSPSNILKTAPYSSEDPNFVNIKYVGRYNQSSFYDGAVFYTLEKSSSGNIIRRWKVDNNDYTLDLDKSFYLNSNSSNIFNGNAFAVENIKTELDWHVSTGTGEIQLTTTSGISKYDTILIGPSNDVTNLGVVEEAYVHSVNGNVVEIKTYDGYIPTKYEYVQGDSVVIFKDMYLFSDISSPISNGVLYRLDHNNYGEVKDKKISGEYKNIYSAVWNDYFSTLSFVRGTNLLHLDFDNNEIVKSQCMNITKPDKVNMISVYDIDIVSSDLFRLQKEEVLYDDSGNATISTWSTYNYLVDSLDPYTHTVTTFSGRNILGYHDTTVIYSIVRDQFGVGLIGRNVAFYSSNDPGKTLDPSDGVVTTDSNGLCSVQYTSGTNYTGNNVVYSRADGGNTVNGSQYVVGKLLIPTYEFYSSEFKLFNLDEEFNGDISIISQPEELTMGVNILNYVRRSFPGGEWVWAGHWYGTATIEGRNIDRSILDSGAKLIYSVYQPTFNNLETWGDRWRNQDKSSFPEVPILQENTMFHGPLNTDKHYIKVMTIDESSDELYVSQNYISRHLSAGHTVSSVINQYVFIEEARPKFWSEKNYTEIDYWIRLRPFSYSLDPLTLKIKIIEHSYLGVLEPFNIEDFGDISMFDAGGGLEGIDFNYIFPEKFHHNSTIYVEIEVYDQAPVPNILNVSYWFKIIPDYKKPFILNNHPSTEEFDVPINTDISFEVFDLGEGIDIDTLMVYVNNREVEFTFTEFAYNHYYISCIIDDWFHYKEEVYVLVEVFDLSGNKNFMRSGWTFYCAESTGPWFDSDNVEPGTCREGMSLDHDEISIQVYGINDTGVDYDSIRFEVGGKTRDIKITPIIYRIK